MPPVIGYSWSYWCLVQLSGGPKPFRSNRFCQLPNPQCTQQRHHFHPILASREMERNGSNTCKAPRPLSPHCRFKSSKFTQPRGKSSGSGHRNTVITTSKKKKNYSGMSMWLGLGTRSVIHTTSKKATNMACQWLPRTLRRATNVSSQQTPRRTAEVQCHCRPATWIHRSSWQIQDLV